MTIPDDIHQTHAAAVPARHAPPPPHHRRALLVRLHFYAGILIGPFLAVAAVTGALYAAAPTIERVVYRDLLSVPPAPAALPLQEQVAAARAAFPQLTMTGLRPPAEPADSTRVYFADPALGDDLLRAVFVDPYTGRVLGDEQTWLGYLPVSTWLDGLHRHLNLGEPGRLYSELAASWLWVVALGGLWLWLIRSARDHRDGRMHRVVMPDRTARGRSRTLSWHGATGVWLLAGLLFLSATGITWSTYAGAHVSDLRAAMNWQRPQLDTVIAGDGGHAGHGGPVTQPGVDAASVDYSGVLAAAADAGVRSPVELTLPAAHGEAVTVTEIDRPYRWTTNAAAVDPGDLGVTSVVDYRRDYSTMAKLADWGIRAHMGFLFGWLNQALLLAVAVGLLTVIVRGYRMWWQRRPTRGSDWAVGRAPLRGGFGRLSVPARAGIVAAAVAVGWFLPLLGVALVAFLVVDLTLAAAKRRKENNDA